MQPGDLRFRKSFEMISDGSEIVLGGEIFVFETEPESTYHRFVGLWWQRTQGDTESA